MGQLTEGIYLVEDVADVATVQVVQADKLAVVTQTTLSVDDAAEILAAVKQRFPNVREPKQQDICYATQNRQDAVKALAEGGATLILVIGSETSSNARRLVEVAERNGATARLIDGESGLDPDLLAGHETVGLTAGASTPEELVAAVLRSLASFGFDELGEVEVARENVSFRLPREVTTA
jgi:4-hydroxy-3-methylbut-2-enyl diphosphate reductase